MTELTLWDDSLNGPVIFRGDIVLTQYDPRTNDFVITMQRAGLTIEDDQAGQGQPRPYITDDDEWLGEWTNIQTLEFEDKHITPVWQPNRFGEPADHNVFYQVVPSPETVVLQAQAGGTAEEVFERGNPYEVYGSSKRVTLHYADTLRSADDEAKTDKAVAKFLKENDNLTPEELVKKLFD